MTPNPILIHYCRCAEKYSRSHLHTTAKENWLEMGLLSITFSTRTTADGQLAIEVYIWYPIFQKSVLRHGISRHDEIANLLGVATKPFMRQHKAQVTEMQWSILCYVKSLHDMLNINAVEGPAPGHDSAQGVQSAPGKGSAIRTHLKPNKVRFPELLPSFSPRKCTKKALEILMRQNLAHHYHMFYYL